MAESVVITPWEQKRGFLAEQLGATWRFIRRWPVIPGAVLVILIFTAVFAPLLAPHDVREGGILRRHIPPMWMEGGSSDHVLGTDHAGRDVFSRLIFGARISMAVAAISLASGFIVGTSLGMISGYAGGILDEVVSRFVDIWLALPFLMVALVTVMVFGQSLWLVLVLLALLAWVSFVRVIRSQTLQLKVADYVSLARVAGASHFRIVAKHIFPGVLNTAIVIATLNVGTLILAEATLSFLGAGIPAPQPAWGVMVADGRGYIGTSWWPTFFPGLAIFLVVMSLNFMGDWARDRFDPRLRQID
jgi:peptide/nickel transport system permease protein